EPAAKYWRLSCVSGTRDLIQSSSTFDSNSSRFTAYLRPQQYTLSCDVRPFNASCFSRRTLHRERLWRLSTTFARARRGGGRREASAGPSRRRGRCLGEGQELGWLAL